MEPIALVAAAAVVLFALLRRPGFFSPALVLEGESRCEAPASKDPEGDDEEQMPETDRAPGRPWLPWAVAAIGLLRVTLLVTLHA
jgi:hypothetical protein